MLYIKKGNEPSSLTEYRKKTFVSYNECDKKDDIRESLLKEQGCLCAYCMRKITKQKMKIEHWYPEDKLSESERLNYKNMLGVCMGHIEGQKGSDDTCDTHKKNSVIKINPTDPKMIAKIKYKSRSGEIYSDDEEIQRDLDVILNLNSKGHQLQQNRKAKLDSVINELSRRYPNGSWNKEKLRKFYSAYSKPNKDGMKPEYLGIVEWWISKHMNK